MVPGDKRTCAIVPAYNEEANIQAVIEDIRHHQPGIKIIVIDDASSDRTETIVRRLNETVIRLPINLGIGGAVQTGMKYARDNGYDYAIQFDGDGQHMAGEIEKIIRPVIDGSADMVIGSRFLGEGNYHAGFLRRIGIGLIRLVNSLLLGLKITDNTSGFRAYSRGAIAFIARFYPQDYPEPEAVIELSRNGFRIAEVAVAMRERSNGKSSIGTLSSMYYIVKVLMSNLIAFSRSPIRRESR